MRAVLLALPLAVFVTAVGCDPAKPSATAVKTAATAKPADDDHDHGAGPHGGTVIEFGKWHGEFCVDHGKKQATVYILSGNLKRPAPLPTDTLSLSVKQPKLQVTLKATPLESDPAGQASRFVATHDAFGVEQEFEGTVSGVIAGKPYLGDFKEKADAGHDHGSKPGHAEVAMPAASKGDDAARTLYLTPGGAYTAADIAANGPVLPAAKFKGIKANHNIDPAVGDKLCPVTLTKSNPAFSWVIAGKTYEVCCPPCLDELVQLAKDKPGDLKEPEAYRKK